MFGISLVNGRAATPDLGACRVDEIGLAELWLKFFTEPQFDGGRWRGEGRIGGWQRTHQQRMGGDAGVGQPECQEQQRPTNTEDG